uniref:Vitelline membrane outer layer 1 homolog n=1 Tax=Latimeria chalumnae TaxID=7897 RepID=H3ALL4_LATCH
MMQVSFVFVSLAVVFFPSAHATVYYKANGTFAERTYASIITVGNGGPWGGWTWMDLCPEGSYAIGFSIRVESDQGAGDDTALNGIRLLCSSSTGIAYSVESDIGLFGDWSYINWCPLGYLKAFQLRVEPPQGILGNTAANNIKFRCSSGPIIEAPGLTWGEYDAWSNTCAGAICGLQTKQEPYQGIGDDTALNDVRFFCCN